MKLIAAAPPPSHMRKRRLFHPFLNRLSNHHQPTTDCASNSRRPTHHHPPITNHQPPTTNLPGLRTLPRQCRRAGNLLVSAGGLRDIRGADLSDRGPVHRGLRRRLHRRRTVLRDSRSAGPPAAADGPGVPDADILPLLHEAQCDCRSLPNSSFDGERFPCVALVQSADGGCQDLSCRFAGTLSGVLRFRGRDSRRLHCGARRDHHADRPTRMRR